MMGVAVGLRHEKFMACISSHEKTPRRIIRKAAKLATRYNTTFIALYVQTRERVWIELIWPVNGIC